MHSSVVEQKFQVLIKLYKIYPNALWKKHSDLPRMKTAFPIWLTPYVSGIKKEVASVYLSQYILYKEYTWQRRHNSNMYALCSWFKKKKPLHSNWPSDMLINYMFGNLLIRQVRVTLYLLKTRSSWKYMRERIPLRCQCLFLSGQRKPGRGNCIVILQRDWIASVCTKSRLSFTFTVFIHLSCV